MNGLCRQLGLLAAVSLQVVALFAFEPSSSAMQAVENADSAVRTVSFDDALAANTTDGKLLVVIVTSRDSYTSLAISDVWSATEVLAWTKQHAVVIEASIDHNPLLSKRLDVRVLPMLVLFREGKEFDRALGALDASDVLPWMKDAHAGKVPAKPLDRYTEDLDGRFSNFSFLQNQGRFSHALDEILWIWNNCERLEETRSIASFSKRSGSLPMAMRLLARDYPPAHHRFVAMRDEIGAVLQDKAETVALRRDWVGLNFAIGDDVQILAWFDEVSDQPESEPVFELVWPLLKETLVRSKRLADYGKFLDVKQEVAACVAALQTMTDLRDPERVERRTEFVDHVRGMAARDLATLYSALLAANRRDDAVRAAEMAASRMYAPSERRVILLQAVGHGLASQPMLELLDEADKRDTNPEPALRKRLQEALEDVQGK